MNAGPDPRATAYLVFAQDTSTTLDVAAWDRQAARFFGKTLLSATPDGSQVILESGEQRGGRRVFARPREVADLALAERAEARTGGGMGLLARRCPVVWHVVREGEPDLVALELAAIVASVVLGPILDARVPELLGVKTARARLEGA